MHTLCWLYLDFENKHNCIAKKLIYDFNPTTYMGPCSFAHVIFNYKKKCPPQITCPIPLLKRLLLSQFILLVEIVK